LLEKNKKKKNLTKFLWNSQEIIVLGKVLAQMYPYITTFGN